MKIEQKTSYTQPAYGDYNESLGFLCYHVKVNNKYYSRRRKGFLLRIKRRHVTNDVTSVCVYVHSNFESTSLINLPLSLYFTLSDL